MKKKIIVPELKEDNVVLQVTEQFVLDKAVYVTVPHGYKAIAIVDEVPIFRIDPCNEKRLLDVAKPYKGKSCKLAFVQDDVKFTMMWGVGNIQVNNERIKEAYRVGANGTYTVEVADPVKLCGTFHQYPEITTDLLREKTVDTLKNLALGVLGSFFANTNISVFEISEKATDIRQKLLNALTGEIALKNIGVKLVDLVVSGIHVNEEDLELIRSRINGAEEVDGQA